MEAAGRRAAVRTNFQRAIIGLVALVAVGVISSTRMVSQYVTDESRTTIIGGWTGVARSSAAAAAAAAARSSLDDVAIERVLTKLRSGELQLLGQTRASFSSAIRALGTLTPPVRANAVSAAGAEAAATAAAEAALLALPLSTLLASPRSALPSSVANLGAPETPLLIPAGASAPRPRLSERMFAETARVEPWERAADERRRAPARAKRRAPTLDEALARARAASGPDPGPVLATFVNFKRYDFGLTWVRRCEALGLRNFVVGALDEEALALLEADGVPTFQMGASASRPPLPGSDYGWNSHNFKKMGVEKVQLLADLLAANATALLMDADAVLIHDPLPYFARWPEADVLVTTDYIGEPTVDGGLDMPQLLSVTMNIGVVFARPSALPLARAWLDKLNVPSPAWDQNVFFGLMSSRRNGAGFAQNVAAGAPGSARLTARAKAERLGLAFDGSLLAGILPTSLFCTGFTFVSGYCERNALGAPFTFHACWLFYEALGKRVRLRSLKLWHDPPDYYERGEGDRTRGFLALAEGAALAGAAAELLQRPYSAAKHMALVHHQLRAVRSGMLLAALLRRAFVMPRIVCLHDKWWAEHNGTIPHSNMTQPIKGARAAHGRIHARRPTGLRAAPRRHTLRRQRRARRTNPRCARLRAAVTRLVLAAPLIPVFQIAPSRQCLFAACADCPMDHLLDLNLLNRYQQWLPRQHTFLQHESLPAAVRDSRADVTLRAFDAAGSQAQLDSLLSALDGPEGPATARVLTVRDVPDVYRMLHAQDQVCVRSIRAARRAPAARATRREPERHADPPIPAPPPARRHASRRSCAACRPSCAARGRRRRYTACCITISFGTCSRTPTASNAPSRPSGRRCTPRGSSASPTAGTTLRRDETLRIQRSSAASTRDQSSTRPLSQGQGAGCGAIELQTNHGSCTRQYIISQRRTLRGWNNKQSDFDLSIDPPDSRGAFEFHSRAKRFTASTCRLCACRRGGAGGRRARR